MARCSMVRLFIVGALLFSMTTLSAFAAFAPLQAKILNLMNEQRAKEGLPALLRDEKIEAVAVDWSLKMARANALGHRSGLMDALGAEWRIVNENVFYSHPEITAEMVVAGWMKSKGHRANILMPRITHGGVGVAQNSNGAWYVTFDGAGK